MKVNLLHVDPPNQFLEFSGNGYFDLEEFEIFAKLEHIDLEVQVTLVFDFSIDNYSILLYTGNVDLNMSLQDIKSELSLVIGISSVNLETGLLSPISLLSHNIQDKIKLVVQEYFEFSQTILTEYNVNFNLSITEQFDEKVEKGFLEDRRRFYEENGISPVFEIESN